MWKNEEMSSKRGSASSFANNIELETINEKERELDQLQPTLDMIREVPLLNKSRKSKIGLGSNTSLALMCKNVRKGRSYSLPFIQRSVSLRRSESTKIHMDTVTTVLSAMYCKILIILGLVFPTVEFFSSAPPSPYYQIFHLYLYMVSVLYLGLVYSKLLKQRAVNTMIRNEVGESGAEQELAIGKITSRLHSRYGSFYLRMGAIGFGIASVIYTGLELAQYFELIRSTYCSHVLMAVTPAVRMAFIVIQLQFIFISDKSPKPMAGYTSQHFTVDCANSHKGLFASILVLVITIISLIMFLVLIKEKEYRRTAEFQVNLWELLLYILSTTSTVVAMFSIRKLKYEPNRYLELDTVLLMMAQTGLYMYFAFSLMAGYLTKQLFKQPIVFLTSLFGLLQSSLQTLFIVDAWWRKCGTLQIASTKPGRQLVTFLLLSNIAMWAINHLENARPDLHPMELDFYGVWTWTIITHISMPLAVFYRFHSTVCFCEIWKSAYKLRHQ